MIYEKERIINMKIKNTAALLLAASLTVAALAGCNDQKSDNASSADTKASSATSVVLK